MTTLSNPQNPDSAELIASPIGLIDSNDVENPSQGATEEDNVDEEELDDEPVDEDGDPTGEHDHHQDDNYALGGHVTRSGS